MSFIAKQFVLVTEASSAEATYMSLINTVVMFGHIYSYFLMIFLHTFASLYGPKCQIKSVVI